MPDTLDDVADLIRAKNAGPFWVTLDVFLPTDEVFERVRRSDVIDPTVIGRLYDAPPASIRVFELPAIRAVKISFPRRTVQGSFADRDMHSGQQHVPLSALTVPA